MPTDRPTAAELLAAVRGHLIDHLGPTLEGQPAFHLRVAINALAIVERTMADGRGMDQQELLRLQSLLGEGGDLLQMNEILASQIKAGEFKDRRQSMLDHLRQTVTDKLNLANPKYMSPRD